MRRLLTTWVVIFVIGYVYYEYIDKKHAAVRHDLETTQTSVDELSKQVQAGDPAVNSQLSTLKEELARLSQQIDAHKQALTGYEEKASVQASERAVSRVQAARLSTHVAALRERLKTLKALDAEWQVQLTSLMSGEAGRKVVANPAQFDLLVGVLERQRPTSEQIALWDTQVAELAAPIEQALAEEQAVVALVPEHETALDELVRTIAEAVADWEQQQLLVTAILKETFGAAPAETTLEALLAERKSTAALAAAIEFTEEQNRQVAAERAKTAQALLDARLAHEQTLREIELAAIEANTQVEAQKIKDAIAEVEREEQRRQEELKARVEREVAEAKFQQALPEIRKYLIPFISEGATQPRKQYLQYESAAEVGPVSFAALQRFGVLEDTPKALYALHALGAGASNDRPQGNFPPYHGGSEVKPDQVLFFKKVQALLKEHGALMVEKGMLAP